MFLVWSLKTLCSTSWKFSPNFFFFPKSFVVLCFTFKPMVHLGSFLYKVWDLGWGLLIYFCLRRSTSSSTIYPEGCPPLLCLCTFVRYQLGIFMCGYCWVLCSVPLMYTFIPSPALHNLDCCNYKMFWNPVDWFFQLYSFFSKLFLAILVLLPFHINFRIVLTVCTKI